MPGDIAQIDGGTITTARGFKAGGTYAGIKTYSDDKMDVGMLLSETPCAAAGVFTRSSIVSPSVTVNRETLSGGQAIRGLVVNSGIANAGVGEQGYIDAKEMAVIAAGSLGVKPEEVLVFSTGIIGVELPMTLIKSGVEQTELSDDGGNPLARAMMTTDTHPKEVGVTVDIEGTEVHIGGVAKGSGMIHPNMATMLCFVATDAAVEQSLLRKMLPEVADYSLNMLTVDGDSSTNDSLVVLANGAAGNPVITAGSPEAESFKAGLLESVRTADAPTGPRRRGRDSPAGGGGHRGPHQRGCTGGGADNLFVAAGEIGSIRRRPELGAPAGGAGPQPSGGGGRENRPVHQRGLHHGGRQACTLPSGRRGSADARGRGDFPYRAQPGRRECDVLGLRSHRGIRRHQQRLYHLDLQRSQTTEHTDRRELHSTFRFLCGLFIAHRLQNREPGAIPCQ